GKLSKRDGDKLGFPVFPLNWTDPFSGEKSPGFREQGYLPDAFLNFLAFLGWNPGDDREIFSLEELVEAFSVDRIGKSGTKFDIAKARWYNEQYLRSKPNSELVEFLTASAQLEDVEIPLEKAFAIVALVRDRVTFPGELWKESRFVMVAPTEFDQDVAAKKWNSDAVKVLTSYAEALDGFSETFDAISAKSLLESTAEAEGIKLGKVMQAVRLAVTGLGGGPDLMEVFAILGPAEVAKRVRFALETLKKID
ncbi:MAG: glutamate--tRNA ligase, partial [Cytophagales bacterium]